jgi:succinate dehydrogenase/fumarate reductase flavoprotein subunit
MKETVIKGSVLIVGGGNAACAAAIEASKNGAELIVIDKARLGRSGSSATSGGNYQTWIPEELGGHPEDTLERFIENVVQGGEYLSDQHMTEIYAREGVDRIVELDDIGFPCAKTPDGKFRTALTFGMTYPRFLGIGGLEKKGDWGEGHTVMKLLRKEVMHRNARVLEGVMITQLFTSGDRIAGAYGFNKYSGETLLFQVKAVILAAGSALGVYQYGSANYLTTGDGYRLGYDLGCPLNNMEFEEFTVIPVPRGIPVFTGGSKPATSRGGRFVNSRDEYFMEHYDSQKRDLTTRGRMIQAISREIREGRGPVMLDATEVPVGRGGHLLKKLMHLGVDHRKEKIPVMPGIHTFLGGLLVDKTGATSVPGLFAAGENAGQGNIYGADRVGGALTACHVLGCRAGRHAALYAANVDYASIKSQNIRKERERILGFSRHSKGEKPRTLKSKIQTVADHTLNVYRNKIGLQKALTQMMEFQKEARENLQSNTPRDIVEAMEADNLALTGEMIARASLAREESRGQFVREDFPFKDNKGWLQWVTIEKQTDGMKVYMRPVPMDQYPFKPK